MVRLEQFDQITFHFLSPVPSGQPGIHITMWIVLVLAGFLTLLAGILIGLPTLRLRGDYLAIVTLGFGEMFRKWYRTATISGASTLPTGHSGSHRSTPSVFPT